MDGGFILLMAGALIIGRFLNEIWPWNDLGKPSWQALVAIIVLGGGFFACWSAIR